MPHAPPLRTGQHGRLQVRSGDGRLKSVVLASPRGLLGWRQ